MLAVGLPNFVTAVSRAVVDASAPFDPTNGPPLLAKGNGSVWVAPTCDTAMASDRLWK